MLAEQKAPQPITKDRSGALPSPRVLARTIGRSSGSWINRLAAPSHAASVFLPAAQWHLATGVPTHSGGSAPASHRFPFSTHRPSAVWRRTEGHRRASAHVVGARGRTIGGNCQDRGRNLSNSHYEPYRVFICCESGALPRHFAVRKLLPQNYLPKPS